MTTFHLGTMGYGYKDWLGAFYPEKTKPDTARSRTSALSLYSRVFDSVEMDTTFYAIPRTEIVERWREQTPDGFIFCPKTPRAITHETDLDNGLTMMEDFVHAMAILEEKLGPILIQFPPDFDVSNAGKVNRFLGRLPVASGPVWPRYAVEFRHRSWDTQDTAKLLFDHNVCWTSTEYIIMASRLHRTTDFLYLRFLGRHGAFEQKNRVQKDVIPTLEKWKEWLDTEQQRENPPTEVYAYFNDDFSGHSPATVNDFKALLGLPVIEPEIPKQAPLL